MAIQRLKLTCKTLAICAIGAGLMSSVASAAGNKADSGIHAQYREDVAHCNSAQATQDRNTCLKEAGAAQEEARRNQLVTGNPNYQQDAVNRCKALPTDRQQDCLMQMSGQDTVTKGNVGSGGVLRETTITMPAK